MTLKELSDQVLRLISSANPPVSLGSSQLYQLLFDCMCEAAQKSNMHKLRTTASIDYDATNSFYFPAGMMKLQEVLVKASSTGTPAPAMRTSQENVDNWTWNGLSGSTNRVGQNFYSLGTETTAGVNYGKDKFALWSAPTVTLTGGITVRYLRFPTHPKDFTSITTEIIDFPSTFHMALAYGTAWLFLSAQGVRNLKDFSGYNKFYEEKLQTLMQNFDEDSAYDAHGGSIGVSWGGVTETARQRLP